ncbi:hypothetical protein TNCV_1353781 [Trichonephila clavipes]|nr:hypothetical protein TNCV_1353781 [Trichonephila clavipes]
MLLPIDVQQTIIFRPHGGVVSTECRLLAYVHRAHPHEAGLRTDWLDTLRPAAKSNCSSCSCVAFSVLFRRAVNCIYQSSVDVVARGRPGPWSTSNISLFLESIPQPCNNTSGDFNSVSATLRCVCPDSSLPITRYTMDSGKSRC